MANNFFLTFSEKPSFDLNQKDYITQWDNYYINYSFPDELFEKKSNVLVFLKGYIHCGKSNSFEFIRKQYTAKGIDFVKELNGSFIIIIIDYSRERCYLLTDRLHSKKVFIQKTTSFIKITDNIFSQKIGYLKIDAASCAQYLTSGFVSNSRTLINGIVQSKPATIYTFTNGRFIQKLYWSFKFNDEYSEKKANELKRELNEILISTFTQYNSYENLNLSLSGGYDAACIQVLLNKCTKARINCVSYFTHKIKPFSDSWVAKKQCETLNNPIELYPAFNGDFKGFILQNAIQGQGISNISFETNFWNSITNTYPIFTGEELFGISNDNTNSFNNIMLDQNFKGWTSIKKPSEYFNEHFLVESELRINDDYLRIKGDIIKYNLSPFQNQMLLYINYRLPNVLLNWREYFAGHKHIVYMPLLDNSIIDFISKLPYWALNNKFLFKETLKTYYPNIFKTIERAKYSENYNWATIINENIEFVREIASSKTVADNIFKPQGIDLLLFSRDYSNEQVNRIVRFVNRKLPFNFNFSIGSYIPNYLLLLRVIILKTFFIEFQKNQQIKLL